MAESAKTQGGMLGRQNYNGEGGEAQTLSSTLKEEGACSNTQ